MQSGIDKLDATRARALSALFIGDFLDGLGGGTQPVAGMASPAAFSAAATSPCSSTWSQRFPRAPMNAWSICRLGWRWCCLISARTNFCFVRWDNGARSASAVAATVRLFDAEGLDRAHGLAYCEGRPGEGSTRTAAVGPPTDRSLISGTPEVAQAVQAGAAAFDGLSSTNRLKGPATWPS